MLNKPVAVLTFFLVAVVHNESRYIHLRLLLRRLRLLLRRRLARLRLLLRRLLLRLLAGVKSEWKTFLQNTEYSKIDEGSLE